MASASRVVPPQPPTPPSVGPPPDPGAWRVRARRVRGKESWPPTTTHPEPPIPTSCRRRPRAVGGQHENHRLLPRGRRQRRRGVFRNGHPILSLGINPDGEVVAPQLNSGEELFFVGAEGRDILSSCPSLPSGVCPQRPCAESAGRIGCVGDGGGEVLGRPRRRCRQPMRGRRCERFCQTATFRPNMMWSQCRNAAKARLKSIPAEPMVVTS